MKNLPQSTTDSTPSEQFAHVRSVVAVWLTDTNEPMLQLDSGVHPRFTEGDGATDWNSSGLHTRTGAQAAVPAVAVKLTPATQSTHCRSLVAVRATDSPRPAGQTVVFWQVRSVDSVSATVWN